MNLKKCLANISLILFFFTLNFQVFGKISPLKQPKSDIKRTLLRELKKDLTSKEIPLLQKKILQYAGKAVPALVEVMKSPGYSDRNRWMATLLLGRIMGKKSAPFISRFMEHSNWVLRVASLKTLLALKQKQYGESFARALKDKSLIVRKQALTNITKLSLNQYAPQVWAMLYDKRNYYVTKTKSKKRMNLIKEVIRSVGNLQFKSAQTPLLQMIQKDKYRDIFYEMDYSLAQIMGKSSPKGKREMKRHFWKKMALMEKTF